MSHLSLVPVIAVKCPDLTCAHIECSVISPDLIPHHLKSTSLFVRGLKRIETLHVNDLDQLAFEHLATLSTLKSLTLEDLEEFTPFTSSHPFDIPRFPSLKHLEIYPTTVQSAISCIKSLSPTQLTYLSITTDCVRTLRALSELYRTIAQNIPHPRLESLGITICNDDAASLASFDGCTAKHAALHQLLSFRNLTTLALQIPGGFDLDDAIVLDMARAWPNLRSLDLIPEDAVPGDRQVSLTSLRALVEHCPMLAFLAIEITALAIPAAKMDGRRTNLGMTHLYVGYSPISDPSSVATFLLEIFPNMTHMGNISMSTPDASRFGRLWKRVEELLAEKRGTLTL
ncbi:hypothetical protein B0H13DRAFT_2341344 [Mycena leptocephala]|nr:hypothetical protein B0H13DRAFT_2341344 [Mycena leptocephala]